jgi:dihydrofolate reductase
MRRIVAFEWLTADGFFASADGGLDWVVPDDEQARAAAAGMPGSDTVLFGRVTYEMFEKFWRPAATDPSSVTDPHRPGGRSPEHAAIATWMNAATKLVFSRTLDDVSWNNARLVRALDPTAIATLKKNAGKTIMLFGSGSIVSQLTEHGLIDEYQLVVCPVFLGRGRPLLRDVTRRVALERIETRTYPSGDVLLRYARAPA